MLSASARGDAANKTTLPTAATSANLKESTWSSNTLGNAGEYAEQHGLDDRYDDS